MKAPRRGPFDEPADSTWTRSRPAVTILLASTLAIWPVVASFPILPPFGLLMLLGWRLLRPGALRVWMPLALGAYDDLVALQPFGTSMTLWMLCFFMIDLIDQRLFFRDFWQNWLVAGACIAGYLLFARLVATPLAAHVDTAVYLQIAVSVMLFPLASLLCAWLDRDYEPA